MKRWDNVVGRPDIHKFAGTLLGRKAKKGIFIYAQSLENKVVLIDKDRIRLLRRNRMAYNPNLGQYTVTIDGVRHIDHKDAGSSLVLDVMRLGLAFEELSASPAQSEGHHHVLFSVCPLSLCLLVDIPSLLMDESVSESQRYSRA
jgi:hypothetical protein